MKRTINLHFHELAELTNNHPVLHGNSMVHLKNYFTKIQDYKCPIDPAFKLPYKFNIKTYKNFLDIKVDPIQPNFIFVPQNVPFLRYFNEDPTNNIEQLYRLDDRCKNVTLVFDYAHESNLFTNFNKELTKIDFVKKIEFDRFACIFFSSQVPGSNLNKLFYKSVHPSNSYSATWYLKNITEQKFIHDRNYVHSFIGKKGNIRYWVPNNQFRAGRAHLIVAMHHKGMLPDTEWNMNSFDDYEHTINNTGNPDVHITSYMKEYLTLFGNTPKYNSYPWNKIFNFSGHNEYNMFKVKETWPPSLLDNIHIYIASETSNFDDHHIQVNNYFHVPECTEKVIKGFVYGIPMFINARQDTFQICKYLGFDVFEDYGKYDHIENVTGRIDKMLECAKLFPEVVDKHLMNIILHNKQQIMRKETLWKMFANGYTDIFAQYVDN